MYTLESVQCGNYLAAAQKQALESNDNGDIEKNTLPDPNHNKVNNAPNPDDFVNPCLEMPRAPPCEASDEELDMWFKEFDILTDEIA